jgi:hypothetical protein
MKYYDITKKAPARVFVVLEGKRHDAKRKRGVSGGQPSSQERRRNE